jgi:hypothetical protein
MGSEQRGCEGSLQPPRCRCLVTKRSVFHSHDSGGLGLRTGRSGFSHTEPVGVQFRAGSPCVLASNRTAADRFDL